MSIIQTSVKRCKILWRRIIFTRKRDLRAKQTMTLMMFPMIHARIIRQRTQIPAPAATWNRSDRNRIQTTTTWRSELFVWTLDWKNTVCWRYTHITRHYGVHYEYHHHRGYQEKSTDIYPQWRHFVFTISNTQLCMHFCKFYAIGSDSAQNPSWCVWKRNQWQQWLWRATEVAFGTWSKRGRYIGRIRLCRYVHVSLTRVKQQPRQGQPPKIVIFMHVQYPNLILVTTIWAESFMSSVSI